MTSRQIKNKKEHFAIVVFNSAVLVIKTNIEYTQFREKQN